MFVTVSELKELTRSLISESPIALKVPNTPEQKDAFITLLKWAAEKMQVPQQDVDSSVSKAESGDWSEALDLMQTFYVMKNIKMKRMT